MIFPYPALRKGVSVYKCRRGGRVWFEAETKGGDRILIPEQVSRLLVSLEGGHVDPYCLPELADYTEEEADKLLLQLVDCGLLKKHSRINWHELGFLLVSLFPVHLRRTPAVCRATLFLLFALPVTFLLSLLLLPGRFMACAASAWPESTVDALAIIILVIGCLLHEWSHALSSAAMGGTTTEMGLLTFLCFPAGFYLAYQEPSNCSRFAQFTIAVSGVSMNALTALICLLLCGHTGSLDGALLLGAIYNLLLVIFNLLPAPLLDGGAALEALTGIPDLHRRTLAFLFSKKERRSALRDRPGKAATVIGAYLAAGLGLIAALGWTAFSVISLFL